MHVPASIVRRNDSAGRRHRIERSAFFKKKKDGVAGNLERTESIVASELPKPKQPLIELRRSRHIIHVDRRLDDSVNLHCNFPSISSCDFGNRAASSALCVTTTRIVFESRLISSSRSATWDAVCR